MEKESQSRQDWIDLTRLLAMIIVMMNHAGLKAWGVNFWGGMFYVPVFFVLSGFCFRPYVKEHKRGILKRTRRLIWPYLLTNTVLVLVFLARDILTRQYEDTLLRSLGFLYGRNQLYVTTDTLFMQELDENVYFMTALNAPTWFLPALFLTMLVMEQLLGVSWDVSEKRDEQIRDQRILLIICLLILFAQIWHYMLPILLPWSVDAQPIFLLLFYIGYLLGKRGGWSYLIQRKWIFALLLVVLIGGGLLNGSANLSVGDYGKSMSLGVINAIAASVLIMYVCYLMRGHIPKALAAAGSKTLPLLCWHYPVLTGMDGLLMRLLAPEGILRPICQGLEIFATIVLICLVDEGVKRVAYRYY